MEMCEVTASEVTVFWDAAPYSLVEFSKLFVGYHLHVARRRWRFPPHRHVSCFNILKHAEVIQFQINFA